MSGRLDGKIAIVTGAGCVGPGWGNGRATCVRFAQEGAKIFAVDLSADTMKETLARVQDIGGEIVPYMCDVTKRVAVEAMVAACISRFSKVDILVNNVGGSAKGGVTDLDEDSWDRQMNFNLKSVYLTCRAVVPHMEARGEGAIVNISSVSGTRFTGSPQVAYASAKAAVIQFSRVTAVEFAPKGIRMNTVVPGQLHTPMVENRLAHQRMGGDLDSLLQSRIRRIPLGWMGDGRDTANAALFLCSDEARFVTGTEIVVDGGMSARCD